MARYIDCSHIEKDFEERFNYYRKGSEIKGVNGTLIDDTMQTAAIIAKYCLDQIKEAPTADVVPKSEVENLKLEHAGFEGATRQIIEALKEEIATAKTDVAREIFEEIENWFELYSEREYSFAEEETAKAHCPEAEAHDYALDVINDLRTLCVAELKKKYTAHTVTAESAIAAVQAAAHEFKGAPPDAFLDLNIGPTMHL